MNNIFSAVVSGDREAYNVLIKDLTDINICDKENNSLLHKAISYGHVAIALDLIERGIDVHMQNKQGKTPLHFAVEGKHMDLVEALLAKGTDVSVVDTYGNTPLWVATFHARGEYGMVKKLIEFGADPNVKNTAGKSPLDFAKQIGDDALIKELQHT